MKKTKIPKVVLDTNIFVSALFNKESSSFKIFKMAKEGKIKILWSSLIKKEIQTILDNLPFSKKRKREFLSLLKKENKVFPKKRLNLIKEDPEDNKFLECAFFGKANFILTHDFHLLSIKNFKNIKIIKPKEFIKIYGRV